MKVSTHVALQALGFVITIGTAISGQVPPKLQPFIIGAVSAAQGGLAWYNHYYNPDGTRAK